MPQGLRRRILTLQVILVGGAGVLRRLPFLGQLRNGMIHDQRTAQKITFLPALSAGIGFAIAALAVLGALLFEIFSARASVPAPEKHAV